ncbi:AraC family transcriptional regulator [Sphingobacterium sp. Lzh-3]|uniref:AraC family transcriptional regulator n=1 Tax=Sphingobacterium sp. Lzh-3 TaxID=3382150 RepID=UPI00398D4E39
MGKHVERNFEELKIQLKSESEILFFSITTELSNLQPRSHDFFMLLLFEHGIGVHTIDSVDFEIRPQQFHFLQPGQVHRYQFKGDIQGCGLVIHSQFFETFSAGFRFALQLYRKFPVLDLGDEDFNNLKKEFKGIEHEIVGSKMFKELIIAKLFVVAFSISRVSKEYFDDLTIYEGGFLFAEYQHLIDKHFVWERSVSFYAEKLNVSRNYLNYLVKRYIGRNATSLINDRVILKAKDMLSSGMSVKKTAYALNFMDVSYFSRYFKRHTQITPRAFSKQYH